MKGTDFFKNLLFNNINICILILITIAGAAIRLWGTNWGLPSLLHPDEGTIVNSAIV